MQIRHYVEAIHASMHMVVQHSPTRTLLHSNGLQWYAYRFAPHDLNFKMARRLLQFLCGHMPCQHYLDKFGLRISTNFTCPCSCYSLGLSIAGTPLLETPHHVILCTDEDMQAAKLGLGYLLQGDLSVSNLLTHPHALALFLSRVAAIQRRRGRFWA